MVMFFMCDIPLWYTDKERNGGGHSCTWQLFDVYHATYFNLRHNMQGVPVTDCTQSSLYVFFKWCMAVA